ncbi:unnamed protein product [Fraxinus pennsylvanica]|uniref:Protein root UVB sensitive/RUS domain-containing protein n=1 Tax=Fraxinus pennsylvanica TaxID=56036 RepID=A0AAD1ZEG0_9LAMI|nr:unnamed protein product [Fraxinus pennsylvanica]
MHLESSNLRFPLSVYGCSIFFSPIAFVFDLFLYLCLCSHAGLLFHRSRNGKHRSDSTSPAESPKSTSPELLACPLDNTSDARVILIDEPVPTVSSSLIANNDRKGKETEREMLLDGGTTDTKPRVRTREEIIAKYRNTGDASTAAAQAKDKLLERQEKLEVSPAKDGAGRIGKMLFARQGRKFDYDLKHLRIAGDLLMKLGAGIELETAPVPHLFLPLACVANVTKNVAVVTSTSTRRPLLKEKILEM